MKLEPNMYVRTPYGIDKIKDIVLNGTLYEDSGLYLEKNGKMICGKEEMKNLKASHNIIDLIEVGDYANGVLITDISEDNKGKYVFGYSKGGFEGEIWFYNNEIKSIVTKEQFEAMAYKVV